MNIALTKHFEELIARLVSSGRYNNSSEVVRAALRKLDEEEKSFGLSIISGWIPAPSLTAQNRSSRGDETHFFSPGATVPLP